MEVISKDSISGGKDDQSSGKRKLNAKRRVTPLPEFKSLPNSMRLPEYSNSFLEFQVLKRFKFTPNKRFFFSDAPPKFKTRLHVPVAKDRSRNIRVTNRDVPKPEQLPIVLKKGRMVRYYFGDALAKIILELIKGAKTQIEKILDVGSDIFQKKYKVMLEFSEEFVVKLIEAFLKFQQIELTDIIGKLKDDEESKQFIEHSNDYLNNKDFTIFTRKELLEWAKIEFKFLKFLTDTYSFADFKTFMATIQLSNNDFLHNIIIINSKTRKTVSMYNSLTNNNMKRKLNFNTYLADRVNLVDVDYFKNFAAKIDKAQYSTEKEYKLLASKFSENSKKVFTSSLIFLEQMLSGRFDFNYDGQDKFHGIFDYLMRVCENVCKPAQKFFKFHFTLFFEFFMLLSTSLQHMFMLFLSEEEKVEVLGLIEEEQREAQSSNRGKIVINNEAKMFNGFTKFLRNLKLILVKIDSSLIAFDEQLNSSCKKAAQHLNVDYPDLSGARFLGPKEALQALQMRRKQVRSLTKEVAALKTWVGFYDGTLI
eukprot:snap_masked-scaffold_36-processed-gene-0.45-mRNA-1 protein AED:1.00 eAED:1.00 QI:0/-1/0/0/-1/1/1/0/534